MCECGCVTNDEHYKFPGPGKTFYVLTIHGGCVSCDSPPLIDIEHVSPGTHQFDWYQELDSLDGDLPFEKWADGRRGMAIACGWLRHEFIKAGMSHLVGVSTDEMGEEGKIDESGADVILEEMFDDVTFRPRLIV